MKITMTRTKCDRACKILESAAEKGYTDVNMLCLECILQDHIERVQDGYGTMIVEIIENDTQMD